jgi:hypothetical protein
MQGENLLKPQKNPENLPRGPVFLGFPTFHQDWANMRR